MSEELVDIREIFISECYELLESMEKDLLELDTSNADNEVLNSIFRGAHSMKGGAGALGFKTIFSFTHSMEALLDGMREGKIAAAQEIVDTLLAGVDVVRQMVDHENNNTAIPDGIGNDILKQIEAFLTKPAGGGVAAHPGEVVAAEEVSGIKKFRIAFKPHRSLFTTGNDPLFILKQLKTVGDLQIDTIIEDIPDLEKIAPEECYLSWNLTLETDQDQPTILEFFEFVEDHADITITVEEAKKAEVKEVANTALVHVPAVEAVHHEKDTPHDKDKEATAGAAGAAATVRVDTAKIDTMVNMVGELVIAQSMLISQTETLHADVHRKLAHSLNDLSRRTRELQEAVMAVRMQPVKSIFSRMNRLVRDLSRQLGKEIKLVTFGENTEIDKTIIEKLSDPITHMIRNAADHGLEMPEKRMENGKTAEGTIRLSADHLGSKIVITVEDDGAGINREKVYAKAVSKGLIAPESVLTPKEIDSLVFLPGFSTMEAVSTISGRGVGMDVVDRNIKELGGNISTYNTPGQGLRFTITLPLTLAILDGMVVSAGGERYIIPVANIVETLRPDKSNMKTIADGNDLINIRGDFIPVIYLYKIFNIKNAIQTAAEGLVILIESGRNKFGLVVDHLIGQQQVVIKSIDSNNEVIQGVSGATILGDGKISLILDAAVIYMMLENNSHHEHKAHHSELSAVAS